MTLRRKSERVRAAGSLLRVTPHQRCGTGGERCAARAAYVCDHIPKCGRERPRADHFVK